MKPQRSILLRHGPDTSLTLPPGVDASPLESLRSEHIVILAACETALDLSRSLKSEEAVPHEALLALSGFFHDYVEERHCRKEKDLLLPLASSLFGYQTPPQHEEGSWWVRSLDQIASAYANGCQQAGRRWADTAANYVRLLRERIESEEMSLFPRIESALSAEEARDLRGSLEEMEHTLEVAA